jgi:hypothetical protein
LTTTQVPKQIKEVIGGKHKNKESSGMGHSMGRVHMQKQDLNTMNLMKFKVRSPHPTSVANRPRALPSLPRVLNAFIYFNHVTASGHEAQDVGSAALRRSGSGGRQSGQRRRRGVKSLQELTRHSI